eukprot:6217856-Amphidinium_carterae.1
MDWVKKQYEEMVLAKCAVNKYWLTDPNKYWLTNSQRERIANSSHHKTENMNKKSDQSSCAIMSSFLQARDDPDLLAGLQQLNFKSVKQVRHIINGWGLKAPHLRSLRHHLFRSRYYHSGPLYASRRYVCGVAANSQLEVVQQVSCTQTIALTPPSRLAGIARCGKLRLRGFFLSQEQG